MNNRDQSPLPVLNLPPGISSSNLANATPAPPVPPLNPPNDVSMTHLNMHTNDKEKIGSPLILTNSSDFGTAKKKANMSRKRKMLFISDATMVNPSAISTTLLSNKQRKKQSASVSTDILANKQKRTYKKMDDDQELTAKSHDLPSATSDGIPLQQTDLPQDTGNDPYEGDEPEEEDDDEQSLSDDERLKRQREEVLQIRRSLAAQLTPAQENRYEVFRNSKIDTKHIEDILSGLPIKKTKEFTIKIIGALGKLYTGELVEKSRDVMREWGDQGPIRPVHIREAHRRMQADGQLFYAPKPSPFKR